MKNQTTTHPEEMQMLTTMLTKMFTKSRKSIAATLLTGCLLIAAAATVITTPPVEAEAGSSDIINSAVSSNITATLTNSGSITASISTTLVYTATYSGITNASNRIRLIVKSDPSLNAFISYAPRQGGTNFILTPGSTGWFLQHGSITNFVTERPHLWNDDVSITVTSSIAASNSATFSIPVWDEFHPSL